MTNRVLGLVGPTAAGKSTLGLEVAARVGGEVVNADSMQLYRGMDIGTAKVSLAERRGVPHHLLDVWHVTETASVAAYQRMARDCLDGLLARGITPIVVGGSGLYVRAALDGMTFPGTDPALRARLEAELAVLGAEALHVLLAHRDPPSAAAILPSNGRRIVRALEVGELRGSYPATLPAYAPTAGGYDVVYLGLDVPVAELDSRIEQRVETMWQRGLVEEVRALAGAGLGSGVTASRALGYAQVLDLLAGRCTEEEARAATVQATRRFARRQRSWFRRDPRLCWLRTPTVSAALAVTVTR